MARRLVYDDLITESEVGLMQTSELLGGVLGIYIMMVLVVVFVFLIGDVFRRDDISGWTKVGWIVLLFALPFVGSLIYIIARPKQSGSGYGSTDVYPSQRIQPMR